MPLTLFFTSLLLLAQTITSGMVTVNQMEGPRRALTPGATVAVTLDQICVPGYSASVRNVPESLKLRVFREYGVDPKSDHFEIDHLISLELGGSNDIKNLWPQSYTTTPYNAHVKDELENKLHYMVCHHAISLVDAQHAIADDWIAAYHRFVPPHTAKTADTDLVTADTGTSSSTGTWLSSSRSYTTTRLLVSTTPLNTVLIAVTDNYITPNTTLCFRVSDKPDVCKPIAEWLR